MGGGLYKDVCKVLDLLDQYDEELRKWIYGHSAVICERDMSVSHFDCTNYFDKSTGEIVDGRKLALDEAKTAEEEKYDGYDSIATSELK